MSDDRKQQKEQRWGADVSKKWAKRHKRDPFRWCIYCNADCQAAEPKHKKRCPTNTGLYPVVEQDLLYVGGKLSGVDCVKCGARMGLGEMYAKWEKPLKKDPGIIFVRHLCVGCAAYRCLRVDSSGPHRSGK